MNQSQQIAAIIREGVTPSLVTGNIIIHGAIQKIQDRETYAYRRGLIIGAIIGLSIALVIVIALYAGPQIPPPQDLEESLSDTLRIELPHKEPDTVMVTGGRVAVRPGHGNVALYQVDSNQYYRGKLVRRRGGR